MRCWFCDVESGYDKGESGFCPNCGQLVDFTHYEPIKEEYVIPETKSNFCPWLDKKLLEPGFEVTVKSEFKSPPEKIAGFLLGDVQTSTGDYAITLNQTSYYEIAKVYGKDTAEWRGNKLVYCGLQQMGRAKGHLWTAKK